MNPQDKATKNLVTFFLIFTFLTTSCKTSEIQNNTQSIDTTVVSEFPYILNLADISDEKIEEILSDQEGQQMMRDISSLSASGLLNVHVIGLFGNSPNDLHSGTYLVMKPDEIFSGYLLLVNALKYAHDFGIIAAIDHQPVMVSTNEAATLLPPFQMDPKTIKGFAFTLPPLQPGLHTLTISLIMEPNHHFLFQAEKFDLKENEAVMFRNSPMEMGVLIWVTDTPPSFAKDWPQISRSIAPEDTSSINSIIALRKKAEPGKPALIFQPKDTLMKGENFTYYIHFSAPILGKGEFETVFVTLWDDRYPQTQRLSFDTARIASDEYFPVNFQVPDQLGSGQHTLTIIAYPYPYYLHWWEDGQEWHPNISYFSYIAARLPVEIQ